MVGSKRAARACTWMQIHGSEWFHHIAWDIGFAALRADGTMAVLAATDTD